MRLFARHWPRILVTLIPLVFALLHAGGVLRLDVLQRLDDILYDARLRATMPRTLDERIVIVDVDEKSLAEVGHWPWGRHHLADLVDELLRRQQACGELKEWALALRAYRGQAWDDCDAHLLNLQRMNAQKYLYRLYAERVASMRLLPFDPAWDGATNFDTK